MVFSLKTFGCRPEHTGLTAEELMDAFQAWQAWMEHHKDDFGAMAGLMGMM